MSVRTATLDEAYAVLKQVPELDQSRPISVYRDRLEGKQTLILVAEVDDQPVGFKIGHDIDADTFYSWVGGVIPEYRNRHLALRMLKRQEAWAVEKGFRTVRVKTMDKYPAMKAMLQANGYVRKGQPRSDGKIIFEVELEALTPIGTIAELWRYPVKSMLGERVREVTLDARGVEGDRRFAIRTADGKLGSGKSTGRFRRVDGLLHCTATSNGNIPAIRLPTGAALSGSPASISKRLSAALGQDVMLSEEGQEPHVDAGPVHLLTTASLEWLRSALPEATIDARRFRPNLVIDATGEGPVEQGWVGSRVRIGESVELQITKGTERCGMISLDQAGLARDATILRQVTTMADQILGVYARVLVPGPIRLNDPVTLLTT